MQGITQVIASDGTVQNIAEFRAASVDGWLNVGGTVAPSDDGARLRAQRYMLDTASNHTCTCCTERMYTCTHTASGERQDMQLLPWPNLCRACRARHARGREVHKVLAEAGRAAGAVAAARPVLADRCAVPGTRACRACCRGCRRSARCMSCTYGAEACT